MKINQSSKTLPRSFKSILLFVFIFTIVSGCWSDGMSEEYKEYLALHPRPELNKLEIAFIDSLEKEGYKNVDILLPYASDGSFDYFLSFKPPYKLTKNNIDSVKADVLNITKELFSKKVSNNILYDTRTISVIPWIESDSIKEAVRYVKLELGVKDIYREFGFKMVMNKDSTFSKVYSDSLK